MNFRLHPVNGKKSLGLRNEFSRPAAAGFADEAPGIIRARAKQYRLQRASDRFVQSASLPEALEIWKYPDGHRVP
jgi:hypothetical protein